MCKDIFGMGDHIEGYGAVTRLKAIRENTFNEGKPLIIGWNFHDAEG